MDQYGILKEKIKKYLNKKTAISGFLFAVYVGAYAFFREEHLFVHICYHVGEHKHYDGVRMHYPEAPAVFFLDWWDIVFLLFIDIIYKPLMMLEAFLHSLNVLPGSCPWK